MQLLKTSAMQLAGGYHSGKQGSYLKVPHINTLIPSTRNQMMAIREPRTGCEVAARLIKRMFTLACVDVPELDNFLIARRK